MVDARLDDLAAIEAAVWRELRAAPHDKTHGWRVGVLATTDGERADARSVVLREFDRGARTLLIYTDARSPKVKHIESHPQGVLVLWSEPLGWQLRLQVMLEAEVTGLLVSSRWAKLKMTPGAHDYLSPLPPGSTIEHPAPVRGTREHFAVLNARIEAVDWLELHADGHRRAAFDEKGMRWLAP